MYNYHIKKLTMNLNPIRNKLDKMFGKKKKKQQILQNTLEQSINQSEISVSMTDAIDHKDRSQIIDYKTILYRQQDKQNNQKFSQALQELNQIRNQLREYKEVNKKLQQKLQDHQLLQQFYLQQLKQRDLVEKQLKWKLDIISQQIKSNRLSLHTSVFTSRDWSDISPSSANGSLSADY